QGLGEPQPGLVDDAVQLVPVPQGRERLVEDAGRQAAQPVAGPLKELAASGPVPGPGPVDQGLQLNAGIVGHERPGFRPSYPVCRGRTGADSYRSGPPHPSRNDFAPATDWKRVPQGLAGNRLKKNRESLSETVFRSAWHGITGWSPSMKAKHFI